MMLDLLYKSLISSLFFFTGMISSAHYLPLFKKEAKAWKWCLSVFDFIISYADTKCQN